MSSSVRQERGSAIFFPVKNGPSLLGRTDEDICPCLVRGGETFRYTSRDSARENRWFRGRLDRMPQIRCAAMLFDLDGVLIDSTRAVARVWHRWAVEHGFDPEQVIARAHGRPSLATVREYLPEADHAAENREVERREMEDLEGIVLLPGALRLLSELPPDRWTIVTSCTRPLAETRLRAAGLPVPALMVTSNDIKNGKPHPEPYLKGAAVLGYAADRLRCG